MIGCRPSCFACDGFLLPWPGLLVSLSYDGTVHEFFLAESLGRQAGGQASNHAVLCSTRVRSRCVKTACGSVFLGVNVGGWHRPHYCSHCSDCDVFWRGCLRLLERLLIQAWGVSALAGRGQLAVAVAVTAVTAVLSAARSDNGCAIRPTHDQQTRNPNTYLLFSCLPRRCALSITSRPAWCIKKFGNGGG